MLFRIIADFLAQFEYIEFVWIVWNANLTIFIFQTPYYGLNYYSINSKQILREFIGVKLEQVKQFYWRMFHI